MFIKKSINTNYFEKKIIIWILSHFYVKTKIQIVTWIFKIILKILGYPFSNHLTQKSQFHWITNVVHCNFTSLVRFILGFPLKAVNDGGFCQLLRNRASSEAYQFSSGRWISGSCRFLRKTLHQQNCNRTYTSIRKVGPEFLNWSPIMYVFFPKYGDYPGQTQIISIPVVANNIFISFRVV